MTAETSARELVYARSGGDCEVRIPGVCLGRATNWHHRRNKSQGGLWLPSNGLHLCGSGTTGCHGWITHEPSKSYELGWSIRGHQPPADVEVLYRGQLVRLDDAGGIEFIPLEEIA